MAAPFSGSLALRELEAMQRDAWARLGKDCDKGVITLADLENAREAVLERHRGTPLYEIYRQLLDDYDLLGSVDRCRTTSAENPLFAYLLTAFRQELAGALKILGVDIREPIVGSLPERSVNASTIRFFGAQECVIVFDCELFPFVNNFTEAVAHTIPAMWGESDGALAPDDFIREHARNVTDAFVCFRASILEYLLNGVAAPQKRLPFDDVLTDRARRYDDSALRFVLAHEYAHIYLGHMTHIDASFGDLTGGESALAWRQEYQADEFGALFNAIATVEAEGYRDESYVGADLLLMSFLALYRALAIVAFGDDRATELVKSASGTHPPPLNRLARLHSNMTGRYKPPLLDEMLKIGNAVFHASNVLFHRMRDELFQLHKDGVTPHPTWSPVIRALRDWGA